MAGRCAGIDGCKAGWVAVVADSDAQNLARLSLAPTLAALIDAERIDFALIDMPIGFTAGPEPREVEPSMRRLLKSKASSVFSTPCRAALDEPDFAAASFANSRVLGRKLTLQTYAIFPKMREVDVEVRRRGQAVLREGHPEVSFALMAGAPVMSKKRRLDGRVQRMELLAREGFPSSALLAARSALVGADDILDAAALLWSAFRFGRARHQIFPPIPARDSVGLEMSVIA